MQSVRADCAAWQENKVILMDFTNANNSTCKHTISSTDCTTVLTEIYIILYVAICNKQNALWWLKRLVSQCKNRNWDSMNWHPTVCIVSEGTLCMRASCPDERRQSAFKRVCCAELILTTGLQTHGKNSHMGTAILPFQLYPGGNTNMIPHRNGWRKQSIDNILWYSSQIMLACPAR